MAWSGQASIPPVVRLAWLTATVTVDRCAFADLAMSRLDLCVPVVFLFAHRFWPFRLVLPKKGLAGNAAACILAHLFTVWIDALTRRVGLAQLSIDGPFCAIPEMEGVTCHTAIRGIDGALFAVAALLAGDGLARLALLAELARVAVTGLAKPLDKLFRFFPAGWVAAMRWLRRLDQGARHSMLVLVIVADFAQTFDYGWIGAWAV